MTTSETELKTLTVASLGGDAAAYRSLLDQLSRRLRAYYKGKLARVGRGATEAEDMVQEVLLAIHLKRHTYDTAEPLTPWVHTIARYKLIDYLRRTRSAVSVPIDENINVAAQDDSADAESSHDIKKLLGRLPGKVRCAIECVKLEGRSVAASRNQGSRSTFTAGCARWRPSSRRRPTMKTDDLVAMLSANVEPIERGLVARTISIAVTAGAVIALGLMLVGLGVRTDLTTTRAAIFLLLKIVFALAVVGVALRYLTRLARPGAQQGISPFTIAVPFAAIALLGAISMGGAPSAHWNRMILGDQWLECLLSIPIIAIVPFAVTIWAVRRAAPTNLVRTGAVAGLIAGGVSAIAYALHCTDDSLPFVAVWYGGTIVLCTLAGAALGPRLLRW